MADLLISLSASMIDATANACVGQAVDGKKPMKTILALVIISGTLFLVTHAIRDENASKEYKQQAEPSSAQSFETQICLNAPPDCELVINVEGFKTIQRRTGNGGLIQLNGAISKRCRVFVEVLQNGKLISYRTGTLDADSRQLRFNCFD